MWRCMVLTLACAGCTNPDDILVANGTVASVDSVGGQVVRLLRHLDNDGVEQQSASPGDLCSLGTPLREALADAEGNFGFEVFRVETRRATCIRVDVHFPSGSVAWSDFGFYGSEIRLPRLIDWRAAPWLDGGTVQFEPPVPWVDIEAGDPQNLEVHLTHREQLVTADGGVAWQADDRFLIPDENSQFPGNFLYGREPLVMDELRLEDFEGTLNLSAYLLDGRQEVPLVSAGVTPSRMRAGDRLALRGTRVPLSRGLGCPELATPCPLTDGELTDVDAGMIEDVSLTLPTPSNLSAVVLRGAWVADDVIRVVLFQADGGVGGTSEATLRTPDRGAFFTGFVGSAPFVRISDGGFVQPKLTYLVIPVDAGTPTSRVTLQFPEGLARIKEVSIFD